MRSEAVARSPAETLRICRPDDARGLGVETIVARSRGEVLHVFTGEIGPEISQHSLQVDETNHIADTEFIGYLSHACAPNCRLDMRAFQLVALKDMPAGELLTIDYAATEDRLFRQFACHCGAPQCRRWVTGRAEPPNVEGQAHLKGLS
ncbi:MAG: SET domain-containing protein-lysine N-methyltransferase [Phenylobacterium sp.]|uniref:SET domain-containing protein-lysine N-methyltransferase n=1 Tax=Phenylobacterium sp. TaxID=1871053 RepID=UPI001A4EA7BC|nr:SET domain-containing protein-lysine N-methyltransferase [Phenylobacterium sp.]MBL8554961.1 SET domain-containing protein-lysine N-methyltransferase [Phenylobacterium sp.]